VSAALHHHAFAPARLTPAVSARLNWSTCPTISSALTRQGPT
jgi:hypothetical protein